MSTRTMRKVAGASMVELVIFIVVVSIAVVGILPVLNIGVKGSPYAMQRKQAIAIGESLLTEIEQQNFTYCDPNDPQVLTAASATTGATACLGTSQDNNGGTLQSINYPVGTPEARGDPSNPYDNVADYAGYTESSGTATDINGNNPITGYTYVVNITRAGGGVAPFTTGIATVPGDILKIQVVVSYGGSNSVSLVGYRFRYAPNSAG
jgi:MSHA pilin protein MshD